MPTATVSRKGWIVIPAELRARYGLTPGTQISVVDYGGMLSIIPLSEDPVESSYGMLKDRVEGSLCAALLEEHADELQREQ